MTNIQEMSDRELVETVVDGQVNTILAQRRFSNNPLAMPSPTPEQREQRDTLWNECIKRKLHKIINEKVTERLAIIDGSAPGGGDYSISSRAT